MSTENAIGPAVPGAGSTAWLSQDPRLSWEIFENIDAGVLVADSASKILWANRAYCDMSGYRLEDLLGRTPAILRSPSTSAQAIRALWDALASSGRYHGRLVNRRADGSFFHADVSIVRVAHRGEGGGFLLCTMRDASADHQMESRLSTLARQATQARDSTILALASLAEQRDRTTGAHLQRIEAYTTLMMEWVVANHPGALPEWARDPAAVGRCAMLHDIGKVGIPDSVLLKAGPLDEAEQAVMRQHPRLGAEIIDRVLRLQPESSFLRVARDIVAHHHEAWDGTGYPYGVTGDAIPVSAQVTTVADVFDALTSERPYKRAADPADALAWISERSGGQFSPLAVQALLARKDEIASLQERLGDPPAGWSIGPSGVGRPVRPAPAGQGEGRPADRPRSSAVTSVVEEALGNRAGGEVLVRSGDDVGRIYVYRGRVAWAHTTTETGVLTDRLIEEGLTAGELQLVVQECKRTGGNFGESLVEWGLLTGERFREILRRHVGVRVRSILRFPDPVAMFAPQERTYSGLFTFTLAELLEE